MQQQLFLLKTILYKKDHGSTFTQKKDTVLGRFLQIRLRQSPYIHTSVQSTPGA